MIDRRLKKIVLQDVRYGYWFIWSIAQEYGVSKSTVYRWLREKSK